VAVDPLNPSLHIKKTKGEVLKGYHNVFGGRFISWLGMWEGPTMESKISSQPWNVSLRRLKERVLKNDYFLFSYQVES